MKGIPNVIKFSGHATTPGYPNMQFFVPLRRYHQYISYKIIMKNNLEQCNNQDEMFIRCIIIV